MGFNGFLVYETHLQEPNKDHECLKKILQYFFLNRFVSMNSLSLVGPGWYSELYTVPG